MRLGFPAEAILHEAALKSAALIVMGTRGHDLLQGFAFGSVAMRVAHASPVPVWLLQPRCTLPKEFGRRLRVLLAIDARFGDEVTAAMRRLLMKLHVVRENGRPVATKCIADLDRP